MSTINIMTVMKTIYKVLFVAATAALMASCTHKQEFYTNSYASFGDSSYIINEDAGIFRIPVSTFNNSGKSGSVMFSVTDGKATQGTDYTVEPASGVLTFDGNGTQFIEVTPIAHLGVLTGNLDFSIDMVGASGIDLGTATSLGITIKDVDHPLTDLFGSYTMHSVAYNGGLYYYSWTMNITAYDDDVTRIWIDYPTKFSSPDFYNLLTPIYGIVSDDKKTMTFPLPQVTNAEKWGLANLRVYAHEGWLGGAGKYITDESQVVFTLDEDSGWWITTDPFGVSHPDDLPDYPELFAAGAVNYANFNENYPTYFVKN